MLVKNALLLRVLPAVGANLAPRAAAPSSGSRYKTGAVVLALNANSQLWVLKIKAGSGGI